MIPDLNLMEGMIDMFIWLMIKDRYWWYNAERHVSIQYLNGYWYTI